MRQAALRDQGERARVTDPGRRLHRALHRSDSDEVGKGYERDSNGDKKNGAGNEIREDHQGQPADQWDDRLLLLAVREEAEPEGAEKQAPKKPPLVQCSLTRRLTMKDQRPATWLADDESTNEPPRPFRALYYAMRFPASQVSVAGPRSA